MRAIIWTGLILVIGTVGWAESPSETLTVTTTEQAEAPGGDVTVEKLVVGTAVENRELSGEATTFPAGTERVFAWARVNATTPPAEVRFVWSLDGTVVAEVPMMSKTASGRLWSSKRVAPGAWKVAVHSGDQSLKEAAFTVE